jgi:hypothetical protein
VDTHLSSNKWLRAAYGSNLRAFLALHCKIDSITDFGDLPIFQSASAYPLIFTASKGLPQSTLRFTEVKSLNPPYPDVGEVIREIGSVLPPDAVEDKEWRLSTGSVVTYKEGVAVPLSTYESRIYRGIVTGLNAAFYIDRQTRDELVRADRKNIEVIKPVLLGEHIRRWTIIGCKWVIFSHEDVDMKRYPAILSFLREYKDSLNERAGSQKWYELQQPQLKFSEAYASPKLVFPDICKEPRFALDASGHILDNTTSCIPTEDLFLLAVLNSRPTRTYFENVGARIRGGYLRFKPHLTSCRTSSVSRTPRLRLTAQMTQPTSF